MTTNSEVPDRPVAYSERVNYSPETWANIQEIQRLTRQERLEAMRSAIRFYVWALKETSEGGKIIIERSGKQREIVFPMNFQ